MFREYHPTQGRWISPDPAGLAAVDLTNPQSLNRYAYVMNNPMVLFDPLGMCPITDWKGRCVPSNGGVKLLFWQILTISQECTEPANGLPICVTKQVTEIMPTISFGGRRGDDGSGLKPANNCTPGTPGCFNVANNEVPQNPCQYAGRNLDPSSWAEMGADAKYNPFTSYYDMKYGFAIGGYLDAQPMASGKVYDNAATGITFSGRIWLPTGYHSQ
jgi:hypothetical protein